MADNQFWWGAGQSAEQREGWSAHSNWRHWPLAVTPKELEPLPNRLADVALATQLGHTAFYLALSWSRLQAAPETWSAPVAAYYRAVLAAARQAGLRTIVSLHHMVNPIWLSTASGWENQQSSAALAVYAHLACRELGDLVDAWISVYEPEWYVELMVPKENRTAALAHLKIGHRLARAALHKQYPDIPVGYVQRVRSSGMLTGSFTDVDADFIGLHIARQRFEYAGGGGGRPSDRDQVLGDALRQGNFRRQPAYIFSSFTDSEDSHQASLLRAELRTIETAQAAGANVRGYFFTPFFDSFAWEPSFPALSGLLVRTADTQKPVLRPAARAYQAIIAAAIN